MTKGINSLIHRHYSEKQIAKGLQRIINLGIVTVINQGINK